MAGYPEKSFLQSIHGKVIAAFLIGVAAVSLSWLVMQVGFQEMLQTVNKLSAPNEKLRIVNNLSYKIIQLEQLQRANVIQNPGKPDSSYHFETTSFIASLDTLRQLSRDNLHQVQRIDSMELILKQHQKLAEQYFKLRADWGKNLELSKRVAYLTAIIANIKPVADSSVVTTSKKITTTTIIPTETDSLAEIEPKQSFFGRLFGSKKPVAKPRQLLKQIQEELNVQIDTLSVARQDSSIWEVEKVMRRIEKDYLQRRAYILDRELALIKSSSLLHTQMLNLLHTIEAEELSFGRKRNQNASEVVTASLDRMNLITICSFLGAAFLVFLIFLDISRRDKYRKALQLAKEEAENLGQVKQRFLANMSHELRTPLQSIIGYAEQVLEQEKPEKEAVKAIYHSSEHLLQIVNEVLDYSRIVSGKFTFEEKPFALKQLADEVISTLQPQAKKKNLQLHFNFSGTEQNVFGDPFRLRQVLYNLLGNAIKFTSEGSVSLTVKCLGKGETRFYSFMVEDTGIGISEADQARIFNQFEQASAVSPENYGGTGLGLSIVKALVESQGGYLTLKSKAGQGSVFEVQLPFKMLETSEILPKNDISLMLKTYAGEVLVVDDDAFIVELCATILTKHGIQNFCCQSAREVLETELSPNLSCVFLDIRMPDINGLELCKILRGKLPDEVKIFALTAQALPEEKATILANGFDGILRKPFREKELLQVLKRYAFGPEKSGFEQAGNNFESLRQITGNDEELFQKILTQFISETESDLELLHLYLQIDQTAENSAELIHRLTARTGQMGDLPLSEKLREMEEKLRSEIPFESLKPEIETLSEEIQRLVFAAEARKTIGAEA